VRPGNTKRGSIIVLLTSCLTGLDYSVLKIKTKIVSCHTADSKPVKQEVNSTVILPPLVFPGATHRQLLYFSQCTFSAKICVNFFNSVSMKTIRNNRFMLTTIFAPIFLLHWFSPNTLACSVLHIKNVSSNKMRLAYRRPKPAIASLKNNKV
jgi:hypothetical protein